MSGPRLLDLFCCEGGAAKGYAAAGFEVVGVDISRQRRYPFTFVQADALAVLRGEVPEIDLSTFDAIHASPPCQAYSITKHTHAATHPDLVGPTRDLLVESGLPYVIENVPGAPLHSAVTLCGAAFGLVATDDDGTPLHLKRHRLFESNAPITEKACECAALKAEGFSIGGAYGGGSSDKHHARFVRKGGYTPAKHVRERLLGIDWMTLHGLSQSIPPAYAEYVGRHLLDAINSPQLWEVAS